MAPTATFTEKPRPPAEFPHFTNRNCNARYWHIADIKREAGHDRLAKQTEGGQDTAPGQPMTQSGCRCQQPCPLHDRISLPST